MKMKPCKICDASGVLDCDQCTEESYDFLFGQICKKCYGALLFRCPECKGRGKVEVKEE